MDDKNYDVFTLKITRDNSIEARWSSPDFDDSIPDGRVSDQQDLRDDIDKGIYALKKGELDEREQDIQRLGRNLYRALFPDRVGDLFGQAIKNVLTDRARGNTNRCLRVSIDVHPKSVVFDWPLEFLYCPLHGGYWLATEKPWIALSRRTTFGGQVNLHRQGWPLRVLVLISKPKKLGGVMSTRVLEEIGKLADATAADVGEPSKKMEVKVIGRLEKYERAITGIEYLDQPATYGNIRKLIGDEWQPHVVHFIGHGRLDKQQGFIGLIEKDDQDEVQWCNGDLISKLFTQAPRVVLLQACESAAAGTESGYMSLAAYLLQRNILAVIAMQFEIRNDDATTFAVGFYEALRDGLDVDAAVQRGRWQITNDVQWSKRYFGAPVLFMYHPFGIIQPMSSKVSRPSSPPRTAPLSQIQQRPLTVLEQARRMVEKALELLEGDDPSANEANARIWMERACNKLQNQGPGGAIRDALEFLDLEDLEGAKQMLQNAYRSMPLSATIAPAPKSVLQPISAKTESLPRTASVGGLQRGEIASSRISDQPTDWASESERPA